MIERDRLAHALTYAAKLQQDRADRRGFIYIIQCHNLVKVGIANSPKARLIELQVGCPYTLKLLKAFPTQRAATDEKRFHKQWKAFELRGEWFDVPFGELACVINADTIEQALD
jgi:hypothetical protein